MDFDLFYVFRAATGGAEGCLMIAEKDDPVKSLGYLFSSAFLII